MKSGARIGNRYPRAMVDSLDYCCLEARRMLAGDVLLFEQGSFIRIVGDDEANVIEVSQNEAGEIVVTGNDTTINGSVDPQVIGRNQTEDLSIALRAGNDNVTLRNLTVTNSTRLLPESGDDRIAVEGFESKYLHIDAETGDDVIQLADSTIEQSAYVFLGEGSDVVAAENFTTGRNFKVYGDEGNDTFAAGDFEVGRKFRLNLGNGNDDVLLVGQVDVQRSTKIRTGTGDDFVGILPGQNQSSTRFDSRLLIDNGAGADTTALDANVTVRSNRISGGPDDDTIQTPESSDTDFRTTEFESTSDVDLTALIDRVFNTLEQSGIEANFLNNTNTIQLIPSTTTLNFTEGAEPIPVDADLLISGPAGQQFTGATIAINGFVPQQETLSFVDENGVSGQFDNETGVLTLTGAGDSSVYQQAIRNVMFDNTSDNPVTDQRQLAFTITTANSNVSANRPLQVLAVNDAPSVELSRTNFSVIANGSPITLDEEIQVSDLDSTNLNSAIVSITSGFESDVDRLAFQAADGIIGTFDPSTGALTFAGEASLNDYQSLLRTVTFETSEPIVGTDRTIRFTANDGQTSGFDELNLTLEIPN